MVRALVCVVGSIFIAHFISNDLMVFFTNTLPPLPGLLPVVNIGLPAAIAGILCHESLKP